MFVSRKLKINKFLEFLLEYFTYGMPTGIYKFIYQIINTRYYSSLLTVMISQKFNDNWNVKEKTIEKQGTRNVVGLHDNLPNQLAEVNDMSKH